MDNARVHLHSDDFNPRKKHHKKEDLQRRAMCCTAIREVQECLRKANKADLVEFLCACDGTRAPEVFKVAERHGNVVERTPPYRPELHPIEYIWAAMKGSYSSRVYQTQVFYI